LTETAVLDFLKDKVLDFLKDNPNATQNAIAVAIGKSPRSIKSDIAALKEKGLLEREGAKRNGRWIAKRQLGKE
jgi:predicted HTH transcriptional regulator